MVLHRQVAMNNSTLPPESAATSLNSPGFLAYVILMTLITLVGGLMVVLAIVPLAMALSILRSVRVFIINLLVANLVVAVSTVLLLGTSLILVAVDQDQPRPPQYFCRVNLWLYLVGTAANLWSLAAFSISILAIVRFGKKTISKGFFAVFIAVIWTVPFILTLFVFFPYIAEVHYLSGVACFPDNENIIYIEGLYVLFINWGITGGIIPLTISIVVPIICLCYKTKNAVTEEAEFRKDMAKFSLFLVVGGVISVAGGIIPPAVSLFAADVPAVWLSYGLAAVSLFPTPIIVVAYLQPVREQIKKIVTCGKSSKAVAAKRLRRKSSVFELDLPK